MRSLGRDAGLAAVGFTHAEPFEEVRVVLQERKEQGLHGGMQFTYRNPERSTTPRRILDSAETLIVGAWPYAAHPRSGDEVTGLRGEVAAFAWRDHYVALRAALETMAVPLRDQGFTCRIVADDNALVDRAAAVRAGLGWAGKNSNVLLPGAGSWFVLGSIVTDAHYEADEPIAEQCGSCRRCIDGCPTGAIVAEGVVDARRCLAWLVQAEGDFPLEFRASLGARLYGCDDCQTVCPPSGDEPVDRVGDEVTSHDLVELLELDDATLMARVGRWYIPRRDPRYVRRNALVALGNTSVDDGELRSKVRATLARHAELGDPMLAEHARWAATRWGE